MDEQTIFEEVCRAGIPFDNHESDLYIPVNQVTKEIISRYPESQPVGTFINQQNGELWYDLAFKFLPFWDKQSKKKEIKPFSMVAVHLYDQQYFHNNKEKKFKPCMVAAVVTDIKEISGEISYTVTYTHPASSISHDWIMTRSEIKYIIRDGI